MFGPFRGRLGLSWVIAALVAAAVILVAGWIALTRPHPPGGSFVPVGRAASFARGTAREVSVPGTFVAAVGPGFVAVLQEDGCTLVVRHGHYRDCRGDAYDFTGRAPDGCGALDLLPLVVYRGTIYVDPDHPKAQSPAPPTGASCP